MTEATMTTTKITADAESGRITVDVHISNPNCWWEDREEFARRATLNHYGFSPDRLQYDGMNEVGAHDVGNSRYYFHVTN